MVKIFIQGFLSLWTGSTQTREGSGSSEGNTGTGPFHSTHTVSTQSGHLFFPNPKRRQIKLPVHRILKHLLEVSLKSPVLKNRVIMNHSVTGYGRRSCYGPRHIHSSSYKEGEKLHL